MELSAALLSAILPGLGQLYLGERSNGLSLLAASLGMLLVLFFDPSWFTGIFIGLAYLSLMYHAAKDAYHGTKNTESIQYVLGLAVVVGPFCLPLLWQNEQIHTKAKLAWTVVILILTGLAIASMIYLDPMVNRILDSYKTNLSS
ncbi:MAG: hypothetical protein WCK49_05130 [Myxococcaceae bacterium]